MLSLTVEEVAPAHIRAETRGKQRAEEEKIITSKLLILIKELRDEMRGRDEQLKKELRWRDNHLDDQIKKRENNLIVALQQRDDEWREELAEQDKALRDGFRVEKAFISEQFKRD